MDKIGGLLLGLKTGRYWFITLLSALYVISYFYLEYVEHKDFDNQQEQIREVFFALRMVMATFNAVVYAFLSVLMSGPLLRVVVIVLGIVVTIAMINIEKIIVWLEE